MVKLTPIVPRENLAGRIFERVWIRASVLLWVVAMASGTAAVGLGRWFSHSAEIAYTAYTVQNGYLGSEIRLMDVSRDLSAPLTTRRQNAVSPAWSPDGMHIAYVSNEGGQPRLYIMDADGRRAAPAATPLSAFGNTEWLSDGRRILFRSRIYGSPKLALFDFDNGESYLLNVTRVSDSPILWSPDGKWVVYVSYQDGNPRLYMVNPDCNSKPSGCKYNERRLLQAGYVRWPPAWSPDGRTLVFTGNKNRDTELYMVKMNCTDAPTDCISEITQLTNNQAADFAPAWSPDGNSLAFLSDRDGKTSIYVLDVHSGDIRRLSEDQFRADTLIWSPDGQKILLEASNTGRTDIYTVDVGTGKTQRLTAQGNKNTEPTWRPLRP
jgi:TolB protein